MSTPLPRVAAMQKKRAANKERLDKKRMLAMRLGRLRSSQPTADKENADSANSVVRSPRRRPRRRRKHNNTSTVSEASEASDTSSPSTETSGPSTPSPCPHSDSPQSTTTTTTTFSSIKYASLCKQTKRSNKQTRALNARSAMQKRANLRAHKRFKSFKRTAKSANKLSVSKAAQTLYAKLREHGPWCNTLEICRLTQLRESITAKINEHRRILMIRSKVQDETISRYKRDDIEAIEAFIMSTLIKYDCCNVEAESRRIHTKLAERNLAGFRPKFTEFETMHFMVNVGIKQLHMDRSMLCLTREHALFLKVF